MTKSREAAVAYTRAMRDQPPLPAIFPDQLAPVAREDREGVREMLNMRWGFRQPAAATASRQRRASLRSRNNRAS